MAVKTVQISNDLTVGGGGPLFLIAGPCVAESAELAIEVAQRTRDAAVAAGMPYVFKTSFDKANRSSVKSFRGPGLEKGLEILADVRDRVGVPVLTDVHEASQVEAVAAVCDVLQIPAFLCRQTDLILAVARTGKTVNIKKGQFVAPWDIHLSAEKAASQGNDKILLTERGASFGYNQLVVDMRSIPLMQADGYPVVFDATHSVQEPGGLGTATGGRRDMIPVLAKAAVAAGADGVFLEIHTCPDEALCDGPNSLDQNDLPALLQTLVRVRQAVTG